MLPSLGLGATAVSRRRALPGGAPGSRPIGPPSKASARRRRTCARPCGWHAGERRCCGRASSRLRRRRSWPGWPGERGSRPRWTCWSGSTRPCGRRRTMGWRSARRSPSSGCSPRTCRASWRRVAGRTGRCAGAASTSMSARSWARSTRGARRSGWRLRRSGCSAPSCRTSTRWTSAPASRSTRTRMPFRPRPASPPRRRPSSPSPRPTRAPPAWRSSPAGRSWLGSGWLVGRVLHVRHRDSRVVVLDAGMTELIGRRSTGRGTRCVALTSLGGAVGRADDAWQSTIVDGPVCESTDRLGEADLPPLRTWRPGRDRADGRLRLVDVEHLQRAAARSRGRVGRKRHDGAAGARPGGDAALRMERSRA